MFESRRRHHSKAFAGRTLLNAKARARPRRARAAAGHRLFLFIARATAPSGPRVRRKAGPFLLQYKLVKIAAGQITYGVPGFCVKIRSCDLYFGLGVKVERYDRRTGLPTLEAWRNYPLARRSRDPERNRYKARHYHACRSKRQRKDACSTTNKNGGRWIKYDWGTGAKVPFFSGRSK